MQSKAADFRAGARAVLKGNWRTPIFVCLVAGLLGAVNSAFSFSMNYNNVSGGSVNVSPAVIVMAIIIALATILVSGALTLGMCVYFSRLNLGERPPFSTLFDRISIFGKALGLVMFVGLFIILWSLLLYIPGIIAAYRYSMAPYIMAEHPDIGIREAVNRSKEMMDGNKARLFCLELSFIGWILLASLTLGIGYLWLMPYMVTSEAAFYLEMTGRPYGITPEGREKLENE